MKIKQLAHLTFRVADIGASISFYENCLGMKTKFILTVEDLMDYYLSLESNPEKINDLRQSLEKNKDQIKIAYLEVAPNEFIELFAGNPAFPVNRTQSAQLGYLHFSIEVEDIFETMREMQAKGVKVTSDIKLAPDNAYQFWIEDLDGNAIEFMQYTPNAYQITGYQK